MYTDDVRYVNAENQHLLLSPAGINWSDDFVRHHPVRIHFIEAPKILADAGIS